MKKISRRSFLAAGMAVAAAGVLGACGGSSSTAGSTASGEQVFNLKLSHGLAEDHAVHIQLTSFAFRNNKQNNRYTKMKFKGIIVAEKDE